MGLGGFPGTDPQFIGMLGHARHLRSQHGDAELRRAARRRRALRRPRDRQSRRTSSAADRKIIHIDIDPSSISKRVKVDVPIVGYVADVLDEMLKLIECSPQRPDPPRSRRGGARSRSGAQGLPQVRPQERAHQAAVRDREALRAHQGRRVHHLRRRPAPDVGRAVLQVRQAAPLDQLRRPGHDGLRPAGGDGRADWSTRARRSPASPARRRSRCASRSCRPASSTTCRSRS